ncbi:MAG: hypothetical protein M3Y48_11275, partial [Actinomycetota bacterium]|nr:hypothetical protein [Actinomycetota bacterium]
MTSEAPGRTRRSTVAAFALFGLAVAEVLTAVIGAPETRSAGCCWRQVASRRPPRRPCRWSAAASRRVGRS